MLTIIAQLIGVVVFVAGTIVLGLRIRRQPSRLTARQTLRANRLLGGSCLLIPWLVGAAYPGLRRYDTLLGLSPLPFRPFTVLVGVPMLLVGLYLLVVSHRRIAEPGGRAAYYASHGMSPEGLYKRVRNPMSLGYYLGCLGTGLLAGSTAVTLGSLLVIIPSHLFNLLFFEERTREALYGSAYAAYRRRVPFLIPTYHVPRNKIMP